MKRMKLLLSLALPLILSQDIQAQTSSRLIANSHWTHNGAMFRPSDSTYYNFTSASRGGDLMHTMKFDNATTWNYRGDTMYANSSYTQQDFDANNNITSNIQSMWNGTSWTPTTKTLYSYNTADMMLSKIMQTFVGTGWRTISRDIYTYNAAGKLQSDVYQMWDTATLLYVTNSQKNYFYDLATNNLINETDIDVSSGSPVNTNQWAYTYMGTDLLSNTYTKWNGTTWVNYSRSINNYDTAAHLISQQNQMWNDTTIAWVNTTLMLYSSFTGKLAQTEIDKMWNPIGSGTWDNNKQYTYTYNSYGQMTSSMGISYDPSVGWEHTSGDPMYRYYYGPYSVVSAVHNVANNNGDASIYPVPAQNMLHIDLKWNEAQTATIGIYDMTGKAVRQYDAPFGTEYHSGVTVGDLAAGVYMIRINGTKGQIVKQMVVAH